MKGPPGANRAGLDCDATNVGIEKLMQEFLRALYSVELRDATLQGRRLNAMDVNSFRLFTSLGYARVLPIIPPGVPVTTTCAVGKKLAKGRDDRGKAPGIKLPSGLWTSIPDWEKLRPTIADLDNWHRMGAGTGIKCGFGVVAIDADCLDPAHAALVREEIEKRIGKTPVRIGRAPKALYLCRSENDASMPYSRVIYGDGDERVEILSAQFVAAGTHPSTLNPYYWEGDPPPFDQLPIATPQALLGLLSALESLLPKGEKKANLEVMKPADQKHLVGDLDLIREAVEDCPNHFARRSDYIEHGFAIRAALPFHQEEAFAIWRRWCEKWDGGENDLDTITIDWDSFKPDFRIGAPYLFDRARRATNGRNTCGQTALARKHFEPVRFAQAATPDSGLKIVNAAALADLPIPEQQWLVKDMIPANNVTLLGGDGGTGKSLLALQLSIAKASGGEWLGYPLEAGGVLYLSAEDEIEEQHRRTKKIYPDMWSLNRLDFAPLAGEDAVLAAPEGKEGLLKETKIFHAMEASIKRLRPALTVLDTQADLFGGDEIKKIHARSFISMLRGLALRYDTTILLLYHPSLSGMASGSGTSGNVAWGNSVRSRLYLEFIKDAQGNEIDSDKRKLEVKKSNRAAKGAVIPLRWAGGKFAREGSMTAPSETGAEAERLFLDLLDQLEREERYVSHKQSSKTFAPKVFAAHHRAEGMGERHFINAMNRLLEQTVIRITTYRRDSKTFDRIARAAPIANGLFE